jgi:hypothetical protein
LAFLGNVLPKGIKILSEKLEGIFYSYSWGLRLALICLFFAYIFQIIELELNPHLKCTALSLRIFAVVIAFLSFIFFYIGSYNAIEVFQSLQPTGKSFMPLTREQGN